MLTTLKLTTQMFAQVIYILLLIRIVLSWIGRGWDNGFTQFVHQVTEPLLAPIRTLLQKLGIGGMLDFSPIVLLLLVQMVVYMVHAL